ncbi:MULTISPECIES: hypothetical protein [Sphingomonadaceae]|jgi:hypothetical protein|nr:MULTISPECIES: hypothetical protein [Sphingomonadaceae]OJY51719.1 MAG: hypothetical protein BGP17_15925 [Sphingomonas sp. 67-41]RQW42626.1 hypothetical protein EH199_17065 [Novosphingobium sp. LASN5T]VVT17824.1 conserved hypothetical protein [Sphingomonas sp. EC-HK361]HCW60566.1 hypothetical protein [Sphingobium sp.]|tara:strand:- start:3056 stop:3517 length:462 start_codon:yes stop_codon:yes gene_type:complete
MRQALAIAPGDVAPESPADFEAIRAAREKTARFRDDMAQRASRMFDRTDVTEMLGVTAVAIKKQRQRRQMLGVPYGAEIPYPAAQLVNGEALPNLKRLLEAFGDTHPWEQLMLLTTPVEGFSAHEETPLAILGRRPDQETLRQLVALVASWAV